MVMAHGRLLVILWIKNKSIWTAHTHGLYINKLGAVLQPPVYADAEHGSLQ